MQYKYESYLFDVCYYCNKLTGKNYTYKLNKNQAHIYYFSEGRKQEYHFDIQLFYGPLNYTAQEVAEMVVNNV